MNNIVIKNIEPQNIKISGAGEVIGITAVYVNGVNVTEGTVAYVIVPTKTSELVNNSGYITNETDPTVPYYVKNISISDISKWNNKQDELVSGVNIKTINSNSLLGSGNIDISTSYSAGTGIEITDENVINNTITSYDDLDNLPTIPTKISDLTNDSDFVESSELAEVAFNGSYLALSNTPEIPDSTSELINDSGFIDMDLLWSLFPKSTGSGSSIYLTDTVIGADLYLTLGATALSQDGTPTPSSPQDIHSISGSNKVVVNGKNLAQLENGSLWDNSGAERDLANSVRTKFIIFDSSMTITPSIFSSLTTRYNQYILYDKNQTFISLNNFSNNTSITTNNSSVKYIRFKMTGPVDGTMTINDINFMVVKGSSGATTYEPYISQEAEVDLDEIEYCKIENFEDKFIRNNDGTWQLEKNIGKVVLDGSEDWQSASSVVSGTSRFYYDDNKYFNSGLTNDKPYALSPMFKGITWAGIYSIDTTTLNGIALYDSANKWGRLVIRIENTYASDVATFKTWLETNQPIVYYAMATPTYTDITGELAEQLETIYKDLTPESEQTNISQVNADLPFTISATTLKSLANL